MSVKRKKTAARSQVRSRDGIALAFILASLLFSYAIVSESHQELSVRAGSMVASVVAMNATVPENEYNSVAAQLKQKETDLAAREARLHTLEQSNDRSSSMPLYSFMASIVLYILIGINFFLDWRRAGMPMRLPALSLKSQ